MECLCDIFQSIKVESCLLSLNIKACIVFIYFPFTQILFLFSSISKSIMYILIYLTLYLAF